MQIRLFILALAIVLLWDNGYGQDNIYTWRDKDGVLNITDVPPPQGAEILEISPSYREQAEEYWRQRQLHQERRRQAEQQRMEEQTAEAERREAEARQEAELLREIEQKVKEAKPPAKKKRGGY